MQNYMIVSKLGAGSQGTVFKVLRGTKTLAMKKYKKNTSAIHEFYMLKAIGSHENIISTHDILESGSNVCILLDYIHGYTLYDLLKRNSQPLHESSVRHYICGIMNGLRHIHSKECVHRDIKLENVMIEEHTDTVKLIDFGLCVSVQTARIDINKVGSLPYIAPEIQTGNGGGYKADMWSLGVLIYELFFGATPFHNQNVHQYNLIIPGRRKLSKEMSHLLKLLLIHNPQKRLSLIDVINHPWIHDKRSTRKTLWSLSNISAYSKQSIKYSLSKFISK